MIDTGLMGTTAAACMQSLDEAEILDGGTMDAVMIIAVCSNADQSLTFTRTFCSKSSNWEKLGLLHAGIDCVETGG